MLLVRELCHGRGISPWCANALLFIASFATVIFHAVTQARADQAVFAVDDEPYARAAFSFDSASGVQPNTSVSGVGLPADNTVATISYAPEDTHCPSCRHERPSTALCGCDHDPPGLLQQLHEHHLKSGACWVGRADGLLLWRDSPPKRPLIVTGNEAGSLLLDSNQLESTATGGVRGSVLRVDQCGNAWELGYIFAGNFTAQRSLPFQTDDPFAYALAEPGIYGENAAQSFSSGKTTLLARLQSAEFNRHLAMGPNFRWLAGFRWVQWQEQFTLEDRLEDELNLVDDVYSTNCMNNLYGGQLGVDARLLTIGWLRIDSVVKGGAYYNAATQSSSYTLIDSIDPANSGISSVSVTQSPAGCSFVGEVGITGLVPLGRNLDFRFGYIGLWLTGLAQPTQQLTGQQLPIGGPVAGTLTTNGGTLLQGLTLGLEGRW